MIFASPDGQQRDLESHRPCCDGASLAPESPTRSLKRLGFPPGLPATSSHPGRNGAGLQAPPCPIAEELLAQLRARNDQMQLSSPDSAVAPLRRNFRGQPWNVMESTTMPLGMAQLAALSS